ncbi:hypothetical protein ALP34_01965 [Pseudomonas savastanoi pv. glycinea]|nr:hypothetical protein ALQ69_04053 [Pseudomonas savastanoi pv. glycinea]RMU21222.1 hypothetical protein ALP34_01965 [Pseudomonas savastanoi pv. glycinea]
MPARTERLATRHMPTRPRHFCMLRCLGLALILAGCGSIEGPLDQWKRV